MFCSKDIELGKVTKRRDAVNIINNIKFNRGGVTNTPQAIRTLREDVFNGKDNDRLDVPNIVLIFTDGNSNAYKERTFQEVSMYELYQEVNINGSFQEVSSSG